MIRAAHRPIAFYGFRSGKGGIPRVLLNLINGLAGHGTAIDLLINSLAIPELASLHPKARVVDLDRFKGFHGAIKLARYLATEQPRTLLGNREWANRRAIHARRLARSPVRIVVRVGTHNSVSLQQRNRFQRILRHRALRFTYRNVDTIIAVSRGVAHDIGVLAGISPDKIVTLNNPTIPDDYLEKAAAPIDHPWFHPGQPPVVVALGRLARIKDYPTLVRAFARVRQTRTARLMILGVGKKHESLLQLASQLNIAEDFDLPGFVSNPFPYLSQAALFVLCSLREGSPNALIEALAVGTPVVATDCESGPSEILADGRFGRLVPVGDVPALAEAMLAGLDEIPHPERLKLAVRPFLAAESVQRYLEVLS